MLFTSHLLSNRNIYNSKSSLTQCSKAYNTPSLPVPIFILDQPQFHPQPLVFRVSPCISVRILQSILNKHFRPVFLCQNRIAYVECIPIQFPIRIHKEKHTLAHTHSHRQYTQNPFSPPPPPDPVRQVSASVCVCVRLHTYAYYIHRINVFHPLVCE